ncbi:MAG: sulfotransferase, partial [Solirubrobacterales bacterium]|nr:sulfotransferase [Solirubrobacterales bacterium]
EEGAGPRRVVEARAGLPPWPDLAFDEDVLAAHLEERGADDVTSALRGMFEAYAARFGKPRWGEKTPDHLAHLDAIARALPEARFVHLVRDGRGVAASVLGLPFAPGDGSIEAAAADWRDRILAGRAAAVDGVLEVRYEHLVRDPEAVLREVCAFVDLDFDPVMLRAHEQADARAAEVRPRAAGVQEDRSRPPDPAIADRWREQLSAEDVARFEAVAGDLLADLGYEVGS